MGAISGDINTASMNAVDAADLTSRVTASLRSGDRAYVTNKVGTLEGPNFFLDALSVLAVDGAGVLATSSGVGRWLSLSLYSGGATVASYTELQAPAATTSAVFVPVGAMPDLPVTVLPGENAIEVHADLSGEPGDEIVIGLSLNGAPVAGPNTGAAAGVAPNTAAITKVFGPLVPGVYTIGLRWLSTNSPVSVAVDPASLIQHATLLARSVSATIV